MAAILKDLALSVNNDKITGTFLFRGSANVYVAGGAIATATGIAEATDDQSSTLPYTQVKELIRAGIIGTIFVQVTTAGTPSKTYRKEVHYDATKDPGDVLDALTADGVTWPTGKGQGQPITAGVTPVRVKSRSA